jgi:hypothetical protein
LMTDLYRMRCINLQDALVKKWWGRVIENWASTLDAVILLDSTNKVLIDRIRSRGKWHLMKNRSNAEIVSFLEDYRLWFERVLYQLSEKNRNLTLVRVRTYPATMAEMEDEVVTELGLEKNDGHALVSDNPRSALQSI